jgi:hypothetical protein
VDQQHLEREQTEAGDPRHRQRRGGSGLASAGFGGCRSGCPFHSILPVEPERAEARSGGSGDARGVGARHADRFREHEAACDGAEHAADQIRPVDDRAAAREIAIASQARGDERRERAAEQDRTREHRRERHPDLHREEERRRSREPFVERGVDPVVGAQRERHEQRGARRSDLDAAVEAQRARAASREPTDERGADREPEEIRAQCGRRRVAGAAECQAEPAHPDRLVDERSGSGERGEQEQNAVYFTIAQHSRSNRPRCLQTNRCIGVENSSFDEQST